MADPEVRFPETYVSGVPVWAKRRKRTNGLQHLLNLIIVVLALFGAVVIGVSARLGSVEKGGVVIDQWLGMAAVQAEALLKKM